MGNYFGMQTSTTAMAITVNDLLKRYGDVEAVRGISFRVTEGECFGLLGPNGAGKSTTIRLICGLSEITDGHIEVFGVTAYPGNRELKRRIGVVSQDDNLDPDLTVRQNLELHGMFYGLTSATARARTQELLQWMQLDSKLAEQVRALSGGMRRRLVIARALVSRPRLLVLDEPTTGLDPQARHLVWAKIRELKTRGVTILLTTHYMEEAERLADRLLVIDHGLILEQGTPNDLIERVAGRECLECQATEDETAPLIEAASPLPSIRIESRHDGLVAFGPDLDGMLDLWDRAGIRPASYYRRRTSLEDVFLRLTGRELRE